MGTAGDLPRRPAYKTHVFMADSLDNTINRQPARDALSEGSPECGELQSNYL